MATGEGAARRDRNDGHPRPLAYPVPEPRIVIETRLGIVSEALIQTAPDRRGERAEPANPMDDGMGELMDADISRACGRKRPVVQHDQVVVGLEESDEIARPSITNSDGQRGERPVGEQVGADDVAQELRRRSACDGTRRPRRTPRRSDLSGSPRWSGERASHAGSTLSWAVLSAARGELSPRRRTPWASGDAPGCRGTPGPRRRPRRTPHPGRTTAPGRSRGRTRGHRLPTADPKAARRTPRRRCHPGEDHRFDRDGPGVQAQLLAASPRAPTSGSPSPRPRVAGRHIGRRRTDQDAGPVRLHGLVGGAHDRHALQQLLMDFLGAGAGGQPRAGPLRYLGLGERSSPAGAKAPASAAAVSRKSVDSLRDRQRCRDRDSAAPARSVTAVLAYPFTSDRSQFTIGKARPLRS